MKGQGLPVNAIVLAALAILVLVLLVGFTTGGLAKIFRGMSQPIQGTDEQSAIATCNSYCNSLQMKQGLSVDDVKNSEWCKKVFWIDYNKDGKIQDNEKKHCYQLTNCTVYIEGNPIDLGTNEYKGSPICS